jgi:hypothetical protein
MKFALSQEWLEKVAVVVSWARGHWYEPLKATVAPEDEPRHQVKMGRYRCVFSFSVEERSRKVYRHLVIRVKGKGRYPRAFAAYRIAEAFGFSGWDGRSLEYEPNGWIVEVDKEAGSMVLMQEAWPPLEARAGAFGREPESDSSPKRTGSKPK